MSESKVKYASDPCSSRFKTWIPVKHGGSEFADAIVAQDYDGLVRSNEVLQRHLDRMIEHSDALAHELSLSEAMCESLGESAVMVQPLRDEVADLRGKLAASEEQCKQLDLVLAGKTVGNMDQLHGEIDTLCTAITDRDKLIADAVGLIEDMKRERYRHTVSPKCCLDPTAETPSNRKVDAFLATIEQDKEK